MQLQSQQSVDFLDKIQAEFGKNYSEENYSAFVSRLVGYSRAVLESAFIKVVVTCERLPTYAQIQKAIDLALAEISPVSIVQASPADRKREIVDRLITQWSAEWHRSEDFYRSTRADIEWQVYRYARSMAETQAWLIAEGNAPGYVDFDSQLAKSSEEFNRRKNWYLQLCRDQALTGRINVLVPDYVFDYYKTLLERR